MRSPNNNYGKTSNNMKFGHLTNIFQRDSYRADDQIITAFCWGINAK